MHCSREGLWVKEGCITEVTLEQILSLDLDDTLFTAHKDLMLKLQFFLRHIAAESIKKIHLEMKSYEYDGESTKRRDLEYVQPQLKEYDAQDTIHFSRYRYHETTLLRLFVSRRNQY